LRFKNKKSIFLLENNSVQLRVIFYILAFAYSLNIFGYCTQHIPFLTRDDGTVTQSDATSVLIHLILSGYRKAIYIFALSIYEIWLIIPSFWSHNLPFNELLFYRL